MADRICPAADTLTALELDAGQEIAFVLADGTRRRIRVDRPWAKLLFTTLDRPRTEQRGARTFYQFGCTLSVDGRPFELVREVPTHRSFYEPWEIAGLRIWLDAVDAIFDLLIETHGPCRPRRNVRLAVQDATRRICPEPVHPWCPIRADGLDINESYCGEDCWLGPYYGASAHGGLDINHPPGTPIWAPIAIDDHALFHSLAGGQNNNRWRGIRRWPDGSTWILQCHHMTRLTVDEHAPLAAGQRYADGAGVNSGYHHHSHFAFKVRPAGAPEPADWFSPDRTPDEHDIALDPWILFWQMLRDRVGQGGPAWR
jgi:hypothetical protein